MERFNGTLKERISVFYRTEYSNVLNVLPQLLNGYNQTCQKSIGMAPRDVTDDNERVVWTKLYGKRLKQRSRPKLKLGDHVHLSKKHHPLKKGHLLGWTEEVYIASCVVRGPVVTYQLEEWDGTPLERSFYEQDAQKLTVQDDALFRVEKIL